MPQLKKMRVELQIIVGDARKIEKGLGRGGVGLGAVSWAWSLVKWGERLG